MRDEPKIGIPKRLREFVKGARSKSGSLFSRSNFKGFRFFKKRNSDNLSRVEFNLKKLNIDSISEHSNWIRWGLIVLAVFLLSEVSSRFIGLFWRPTYTPMPRKSVSNTPSHSTAGEDYDSITKRNMFNVEGKIPEPFDQGLLDCLSQAKQSTQRLILMGTIVMNDDQHSVALVQDEGSCLKLAVKKDEQFGDNKYVALKVDRKKLCFQVKSTQELEFIEIPEDPSLLAGAGPSLSGSEGIVPINDKTFSVKKNFLDEKLLNLNEILQTARAVPYIEPGTGKFMGFLVQSVDTGSPFAQLGIRQGDVLTGVNEIVLDNAGKGLEAFQKLRNSPKVSLNIIRGGEKTQLSYDVR